MSGWTDIGGQLRKARENQGLELKAVAHSTRIPLATLEALEDSDYSIFPSPTYARSFLAQYSEFLEVDAHEWIAAFETGDVLSNVNDHGYLQDDHDHIGSSDRQSASSRKRSTPNRSQEEKPSGSGTSILQTLTVLLVTGLLIAGGVYAYQKFEHVLTGATTDGSPTENNQENAIPPVVGENPASNTQDNSTEVVAVSTQNKPGGSSSALPKGVTPTTSVKIANPETTSKPRLGPPPKALVIEDEDE